MNIVSGIKSAAARDIIDAYFDLLDYYQWIPATQRMMEALARMMAKHHEVQVSYRNLWKLFDSCHELQIEGAARVSISQLVLQYAEEEDLTVVVEGIARICGQIAWSDSLQETVNAWWRDYTQVCTLPHLQRLQRELDSQRHLEAQKHILKTALAMRRWLHSRDSAQFAEAINTTFTILEHITEAFDEAHFSESTRERFAGKLMPQARFVFRGASYPGQQSAQHRAAHYADGGKTQQAIAYPQRRQH